MIPNSVCCILKFINHQKWSITFYTLFSKFSLMDKTLLFECDCTHLQRGCLCDSRSTDADLGAVSNSPPL